MITEGGWYCRCRVGGRARARARGQDLVDDMWKARRCETQTYRHRTHCRYNRVEVVAAYGRAALHWEADYWQTAEGQDALQHGIAIFCNPRPVQFRSVAGLDSRRWWRDGSVRSPARVHVRTVSRLSFCYEPKHLLDSRCGNRGMDGVPCMPRMVEP